MVQYIHLYMSSTKTFQDSTSLRCCQGYFYGMNVLLFLFLMLWSSSLKIIVFCAWRQSSLNNTSCTVTSNKQEIFDTLDRKDASTTSTLKALLRTFFFIALTRSLTPSCHFRHVLAQVLHGECFRMLLKDHKHHITSTRSVPVYLDILHLQRQ